MLKIAAQQRVDHVRIDDGYMCSTADALLIAYCCTFQVNVEHNLAGTVTTYRVPGARRIVHLNSSTTHMTHTLNEDVTPEAYAQCLLEEIGQVRS